MEAKRPEIYFVSDIETSGAIPGQSSMLTLGSIAVTRNSSNEWQPIGEFYIRLKELAGAPGDRDTLEWWAKQSLEARNEAFYSEPRIVAPDAMREYLNFINVIQRVYNHERPIVFVSRPVGLDFQFVRWYFHRFLDMCPFEHRGLDVRSFVMGMTPGSRFADIHSSDMDAIYSAPKPKLAHHALADAASLADVFIKLLEARDANTARAAA